MKYIVSINTEFGTISAESKHPEDLRDSLDALRKLERSLSTSKRKVKSAPATSMPAKKKSARGSEKKARAKNEKVDNEEKALATRDGHGETTTILREIEERLLEAGFFDKPQTTGAVKSKLEYETKKKFTSRKVSQALGILRDRGSLTRAGKRNSYAYSRKYLEEKAGVQGAA